MHHLRDAIVELYRRAATSLPSDVIVALKTARARELKGSNAALSLSVILDNIDAAQTAARPMCQDTGVPMFFMRVPAGMSYLEIEHVIVKATRVATREIPLRPNAVDVLTEENSGDNTGIGFPVIYSGETKAAKLIIDLMLKGSGSENIGQIYKLPDQELGAERDMDGVRKCVLDTVHKAQGRGCPPYVIGVGVGATRDQVTRLSKVQLLRRLNDVSRYSAVASLEKRIWDDANSLGIGPLGLGGRATVLGVKIGVNHRHPASFFVDVSIACWADRKARLIWDLGSSTWKIRN